MDTENKKTGQNLDQIQQNDLLFSGATPNDIFDEIINEQVGEPVVTEDVNNDIPKETVDIKDNIEEQEKDESKKDILNELLDVDIQSTEDSNEDDDNDEDVKKPGMRVMNKVIKTLIEEGVLLPFDDDKPIEKYNHEDIIELIKANIENKTQEIEQNAVEEFIKTLPTEIQILTKYAIEGGTDIKTMMQMVNKINDISSLEVGKDDELIVRLYLENTNFGTQEDIEDHIKMLKDTGKLQDYSAKFKTKLDEMHNKIIQNEMEKIEKMKQQQKEFAEKYISNVNKALADKKINDITISNSKATELINGLLSLQYESISGRKTNKLGYLLEKYQFKEPNLKLVAEALWLLDNPDEYKNMLINKGKQMAEAELKKALRTASEREKQDTPISIDDENVKKKPRVIKRINPAENFFKR